MQRCSADTPAIGLAGQPFDGGHHSIGTVYRQRHCRFSQREGLIDVSLTGNVASGTLQVVCDSPMVLIPKLLLDHGCEEWRQAT